MMRKTGEIVEHQCLKVEVSRFANGFVLEPTYADDNNYNRDNQKLSRIAHTLGEASRMLVEMMETPKVEEKEQW